MVMYRLQEAPDYISSIGSEGQLALLRFVFVFVVRDAAALDDSIAAQRSGGRKPLFDVYEHCPPSGEVLESG
jgi:hypothetical protein